MRGFALLHLSTRPIVGSAGESVMGEEERNGQAPLDVYANTVRFFPSAYDLTLVFGLKTEPTEPEEEVAVVRLSPQLALVLSKMLEKVMAGYQHDIGKIELPRRLYE